MKVPSLLAVKLSFIEAMNFNCYRCSGEGSPEYLALLLLPVFLCVFVLCCKLCYKLCCEHCCKLCKRVPSSQDDQKSESRRNFKCKQGWIWSPWKNKTVLSSAFKQVEFIKIAYGFIDGQYRNWDWELEFHYRYTTWLIYYTFSCHMKFQTSVVLYPLPSWQTTALYYIWRFTTTNSHYPI